MDLSLHTQPTEAEQDLLGGKTGMPENMVSDVNFTFDIEAPNPAQEFYLSSVVQGKDMQKLAVRLSDANPKYVKVKDFLGLSRENLLDMLASMKVSKKVREKFADHLMTII